MGKQETKAKGGPAEGRAAARAEGMLDENILDEFGVFLDEGEA